MPKRRVYNAPKQTEKEDEKQIYSKQNFTTNKFTGYYLDSDFKTPIHVISADRYGDITIYMRWDRALFYRSFDDTVKVTAKDYTEQRSIDFDIILPDKNGYENCKFHSVRIDFKIELWEEEDGFQQFYLTDDAGNILWYLEMEHVPGDKSGEHQTYSTTIYVDFPVGEANQVCNYHFRFGAYGTFQDEWWYENVSIRVYFSGSDPIPVNMENKHTWPN